MTPYASLLRRAVAALIDGAILGFLAGLVTGFFAGMGHEVFVFGDTPIPQGPEWQSVMLWSQMQFSWNTDLIAASILLSVAANLLYYVILESGKYQASWGMRILGIRLDREDGSKPSVREVFIREISASVLGFVFFGVYGFVAALCIAFSGKKQAPHDMIAKTVVRDC